ncbi:hypothetical protein WN55_02395 [Dufourea novaeangliae]|uniref:Uncharacterized protein n=1 Tax=Dufourea novaeangliae TaxID=178035 RepID=A0A154PIL8_DUFNO|nr:hypothetical protein WN55_02395 [Dufourea novaeangliae]
MFVCSRTDMHQRIFNVCAKITPIMLKKIEKELELRLQKIILNNGGHIEG